MDGGRNPALPDRAFASSRALAAAGGHHMLLIGNQAAKTLLSRHLPTLAHDESIEVGRIPSVVLCSGRQSRDAPPVRTAPHGIAGRGASESRASGRPLPGRNALLRRNGSLRFTSTLTADPLDALAAMPTPARAESIVGVRVAGDCAPAVERASLPASRRIQAWTWAPAAGHDVCSSGRA